MSGLENGERTAVTKTSVSPHETKQEPDACSVQFVVLIIMGFSPTFISNVSFTAILFGETDIRMHAVNTNFYLYHQYELVYLSPQLITYFFKITLKVVEHT